MTKWLLKARNRLRAALGFAAVAVSFCLPLFDPASAGALSLRHRKANNGGPSPNKRAAGGSQPSFSVSVEPLGFSAPGPFYLGQRESLASLDFLDENTLLFTFRVPGLIHRSNRGDTEERQIRAKVLTLPDGSVGAEALWTLHDRNRYLWMLHGGHFLMRDGNVLREGDASLALKPMLQFPGPVLWLDMDPAEQYLVTDSEEPADIKPQSGQVDSPTTARAEVTTDNGEISKKPDIVLRILRRSSGEVMLVSRVRMAVHLPISSNGYLETLHGGTEKEWLLNLHFFTGSSRPLGKVQSICEPPMQFVATSVAVVNTCPPQGGRDLMAFSADGHRLWDAPQSARQVIPLLIAAPDGSRIVRETMIMDQPADVFHPIDTDSVKGQLIEVFDAGSGKLALKASIGPVLDAGGNVAISPSGRRIAVLNAGAIQVYDLPAPPPIPGHPEDSERH